MKLIESIVSFINFLIDKGEAGYYSPTEITDAVNDVVLEMYDQFIDDYPKNQRIEKYLDRFKKSKKFSIKDGQASLADIEWEKPRFCVTSNDRQFSVDTPDEFWEKAGSTSLPPSDSYPIACIENGSLLIRPKIIDFTFYYFATPNDAFYAFKQQNGRYVYDDTKSIDVEFPKSIRPRIQNRVLEKLGVNLRESLFIEWSNLQQQKEAN